MDSSAWGSIVSLHLKRKHASHCCLCLRVPWFITSVWWGAIYCMGVYWRKRTRRIIFHTTVILMWLCLSFGFLLHTSAQDNEEKNIDPRTTSSKSICICEALSSRLSSLIKKRCLKLMFNINTGLAIMCRRSIGCKSIVLQRWSKMAYYMFGLSFH